MEEYLNKGIKDLITQFPLVGKVLDEYQIGCVACSVGSCLLKDIVQIHNLAPLAEAELLTKIAAIIYPDRKIAISVSPRRADIKPKEIKYSPPMKKLVDEHAVIKKWLALIPAVLGNLDLGLEETRNLIIEGIDFIRSYADKYHHAKEEEILFNYFDPNLDILKVMNEDHQKGRSYVRGILAALAINDQEAIKRYLSGYQELLSEHIKKEDEILYPWLDRNLSTTQIGELFSKFNEVDKEFGDTPRKYEKFILNLNNRFKKEIPLTRFLTKNHYQNSYF